MGWALMPIEAYDDAIEEEDAIDCVDEDHLTWKGLWGGGGA